MPLHISTRPEMPTESRLRSGMMDYARGIGQIEKLIELLEKEVKLLWRLRACLRQREQAEQKAQTKGEKP